MISGRLTERISMLWISTGLPFLSTSFPALASSYSLLPFTFSAEYMGGICS